VLARREGPSSPDIFVPLDRASEEMKVIARGLIAFLRPCVEAGRSHTTVLMASHCPPHPTDPQQEP